VRQDIVRVLAGLAITVFLLGHAARAWRSDLIGRSIRIIYDARVRLTMPGRAGHAAALHGPEREVPCARLASPLRIGVGINFRNVQVGDMGSRVRPAYAAMGDAVNVATRLGGRTKYYGVDILAGEATRMAVPEAAFREMDRIRVKGRGEAVAVYEPLGPEAGMTGTARAGLGLWDETLRA